MMKVSATLGGIGSVAISAVPILANTRSASGKALIFYLSVCCMSIAWDRLEPGMRNACMAISPSSNVGMNSEPRRVASSKLNNTSTVAPVNTTGVFAKARSSSGR